MTAAPTPPARPSGAVPVVAGLDLLTAGERHADEVASACATLLERHGGRDVIVATHWAALDEHRHVALVVEVTGLGATVVAELVAVAAGPGPEDQRGLLVGDVFRGRPGLRPVLADVLEAHRARTSGRVVVFPGSATLTGTVPVEEVVATTRIDRVQVLGGAEPAVGTPLVTREFVRPLWRDGELVLHAQPARGGALVPFEAPDPTPCCAIHA